MADKLGSPKKMLFDHDRANGRIVVAFETVDGGVS